MYKIKKKENGFEYLEIQNDSAFAKIALQGAHIFHYKHKDEKPLLWLSELSDFEIGKAIRGGVPICWPRFGSLDKTLPQHGFARTSMFELINIEELDSKTTKVILKLQDSIQSYKIWPFKFELNFTVIISDKLEMILETKNIDDKDFEITQALHSYFNISNISDVTIDGLDKKYYFDALDEKNKFQNGVVKFDSEIDRVYQKVDGQITLWDKNRKIYINNEGSKSAVIWNPWRDKCKKMSGMKDEAYKNFVCIESANAFEDIRLIKVNRSHTLKATIF